VRARPEAVEYTCPMYPEIVRPGARELPDLRHGPGASHARLGRRRRRPEFVEMRRRLAVCAALTVPLFGLAMGAMLPGDPIGRPERVATLRSSATRRGAWGRAPAPRRASRVPLRVTPIEQ